MFCIFGLIDVIRLKHSNNKSVFQMAAAIKTGSYPLVMCNFAPPDMVGHTGKYEATVTACEETDRFVILRYLILINILSLEQTTELINGEYRVLPAVKQ